MQVAKALTAPLSFVDPSGDGIMARLEQSLVALEVHTLFEETNLKSGEL